MATFRPDPQAALSLQKTHNRTLRIIFIPWEEGSPEAKEWKEKSEQWNTAKPDKKFSIVYYHPGEKANVHLKAANADAKAVIYIRGHGSPGANSLKANVLDEQRSMAMTDVCQRMIDMGLDASFAGAIKFHSCYSATVFTEGAFKESHLAATKSLEASKRTKEYLTTGLPKDLAEARTNLKQTQTDLTNEQARWSMFRDDQKISELTTLAERRGKRVTDMEKQQLEGKGADAYIRERELRVPTGESIAAQGAAYMRSKGSLYAVDASSTEQKEVHKFVNIEGLADRPEQVAEMLKRAGMNPQAVRASTVRMKIL
jgi:hypothetical protein